MRAQLLVIAKQPVPGRVKTRLCPPCTWEQAAAVAAASLADTVATVDATPAARRVLVISGRYSPPSGWHVVPQRGDGLAQRLCHAFVDTARPGLPTVLIGMDTPQVTTVLLQELMAALRDADAVLGPAVDGGWWALGLRDPNRADALSAVPMSTARTGELTRSALLANGLTVVEAPCLRDVDTAADAHVVAADHRRGRFAAAVRAHVPARARP